MHRVFLISFQQKSQSFVHSENDRNVLSFWEDNVRLREDGHYELPVPWKRVNIEGVREPCVKSNLFMVQKRYQSLVRKLNTNEVLKEKYTDEMEKMIRLYAEPVPSDEICDGREYYLPHHSVIHPTKGKTRVVFDCAAKSGGVCLNDLVLPGPNLMNRLDDVLLRFVALSQVILRRCTT